MIVSISTMIEYFLNIFTIMTSFFSAAAWFLANAITVIFLLFAISEIRRFTGKK